MFFQNPILILLWQAQFIRIVAIKFPEVTGIGAETINNLINNKIDFEFALIFLFLKLSLRPYV